MFCPGYVGNRFRYFVSEKGFGSGGREEGHPFVLSEGSGCNHHSGPLDRARAKRHLPGGCVVLTIPTASLLLIPPDTRSYPGSFVSPTAQLGGWWCVLGAACTCGSVLPIPNVRQATVRSGSPVSRPQDPGAGLSSLLPQFLSLVPVLEEFAPRPLPYYSSVFFPESTCVSSSSS